jgi:hypothetical protein
VIDDEIDRVAAHGRRAFGVHALHTAARQGLGGESVLLAGVEKNIHIVDDIGLHLLQVADDLGKAGVFLDQLTDQPAHGVHRNLAVEFALSGAHLAGFLRDGLHDALQFLADLLGNTGQFLLFVFG